MTAIPHHRMAHRTVSRTVFPSLSIRDREAIGLWARDAAAGLAFVVFVGSLLFGLG